MSDPLAELHLAVIDDHRRRPRGRGPLPEANRVARRENPACGDVCELRFTLIADPDGSPRIAKARFTGAGCALSQAGASLAVSDLENRPLADALARIAWVEALLAGGPPPPAEQAGDITALSVVRANPTRAACARLAWSAAREALTGPPPAGEDA